jgi:branched-chain amino acid transport system ATP-binding protein
VPEGRGVFRELTVRDNLYVQVPRSERKQAVELFVTAFPALRNQLKQKAGSLSGGQQQMLALARCYLSDPQVIVVDEVSMGLAPLIVDQIYQSLQELAVRGIALLIVEQYIDRVLALAHDIHILNQGQVVFSGAPQNVDRAYVMEHYLGLESAAGAQPEPAPVDASASRDPKATTPHREAELSIHTKDRRRTCEERRSCSPWH